MLSDFEKWSSITTNAGNYIRTAEVLAEPKEWNRVRKQIDLVINILPNELISSDLRDRAIVLINKLKGNKIIDDKKIKK